MWPTELAITEVHACYLFYCKRHSYPRPVPSSALGKRLNELLPSIEKRRISIGKGRKNAHLFTSLDNARDEFVKVNRLTSIRWAEDEELRLQQVSQEMLLPMTPKTLAGPSVVTGVTGITGKMRVVVFRFRRRCSEPVMGCLL